MWDTPAYGGSVYDPGTGHRGLLRACEYDSSTIRVRAEMLPVGYVNVSFMAWRSTKISKIQRSDERVYFSAFRADELLYVTHRTFPSHTDAPISQSVVFPGRTGIYIEINCVTPRMIRPTGAWDVVILPTRESTDVTSEMGSCKVRNKLSTGFHSW